MAISGELVELQPGMKNFEEFLHTHVDFRDNNIHGHFYADLVEH
jgi:hypothetical protein